VIEEISKGTGIKVDKIGRNSYTVTIIEQKDRGAENISNSRRDTEEGNERGTAEAELRVRAYAGMQVNNLQTVAFGWRAINGNGTKSPAEAGAASFLAGHWAHLDDLFFCLPKEIKGEMQKMIRVMVNGALGRMGHTVVQTVMQQEDMELVGAVDVFGKDKTVEGCPVDTDLAQALETRKPDVVVDFTRPDVVMGNLRTVLNAGVNAVVGTTGFTKEDLEELKGLAEKNNVGILVCPNFSMGAVLMMKIAAEVAKYFPQVEIIEMHHDKKLDAPSGTAILTAQKLAEVRGGFVQQGNPDEEEKLPHARGSEYEGMRIHSVRLPGFVASQEIIFGSMGETLTVRNDPVSRECYMPGVMRGCRTMVKRKGLVYGLDQILD